MGLKRFYYRNKRATGYMLCLVLFTVLFYSLTRLGCLYYSTNIHGGDKELFPNNRSSSGKDLLTNDHDKNEKREEHPNDDSFTRKDTATILTLIKEGKKGNLPAIANLFSYPIERPYPIPPIKDSAEFVRYGKIIFDDSIRQVLSKTTIKNWEEWGWRGIYLHDYFVENGFDGGKIIHIMYESEEEKKLKKQYIKEEINSLHPSLRKDIDVPIMVYLSVDSQWIGRLDLLKSDIHRFSLYRRGSDLSALPYFVGIEDQYRIEGSAGEKYFDFVNGSQRVELHLSSYSSSSWNLKETGKESDIRPAYWRSLMKDSIPKNQQ